MPTILIKNVPQDVVDGIRERARRNHRSLQAELMALLYAAVETQAGGARRGGAAEGEFVAIEEIAVEHRARWPEPFPASPPAVELIRSDRNLR